MKLYLYSLRDLSACREVHGVGVYVRGVFSTRIVLGPREELGESERNALSAFCGPILAYHGARL